MVGSDAEKALLKTRTVAVVGLSSDPNKPSNEVATYLKPRDALL